MKKSLPDDAYTQLADEYNERVGTKPHNAYYDRPAVLSLLPDVDGKRILDAGCGPGFYSEILVGRGALVTGLDANRRMIDHYRNRMNGRAEAILANMEEPLDILENSTFNGIISPLAITYVKDHSRLFGEFRRILKDEGWFVFSTEHPFFSHGYFGIEDYFETRQVEAEWNGFAERVTVPSYYHSLGSIFDSLGDNGFVVEKLLEPKPTEEFRRKDPVCYKQLMKFPLFICIRARRA